MDHRGWPDTGQHFTVSRGGVVLEGRHRSLEFVRVGRWQVEGAHCTGQNVVALGIENEGTYSAVDPPAELWNKLRSLCAYLCAQYGIRPSQIYGHRDFKDTACPGDRLYAALPRLRAEVAGLLGQRLTKATVSEAAWPLLRIADRGRARARRAAPPARGRRAGGRPGRPVHPRARRHRARLPGRARLRPRRPGPGRGGRPHGHDRRRVAGRPWPARCAPGRVARPSRPWRSSCAAGTCASPTSSPRRSGSACSPGSAPPIPRVGTFAAASRDRCRDRCSAGGPITPSGGQCVT